MSITRRLGIPLVGLALLVPSLALGATGRQAKVAGRAITLTEQLYQYASTGAPPLSGSNSYVGTNDGRIGAATVHGTARGLNTYTGGGHFRGRTTIFDPSGSINTAFTATVVAPGQFSGAGTFIGGTGRYKGARGKFTFTAIQRGAGSFTRTLKGRVSFP